MKCVNRIWITSTCATACLLCVAHWFHARPILAQQSSDDYYDGTFYIYASIDVDSGYNLNADSYMAVDYDYYEDIDEIEVDGYADQDGANLSCGSPDCNVSYGDDYNPAEVQLYSYSPVPGGHEYGMFSEGYAYTCDDDGEGDGECSWDYVGAAYAQINVAIPPPQISSISPTSVNQGDQGTLTITGINLVQGSGDQLTLNLAGSSAPFTAAVTPTSNTATFSYDFTSYPAGTYTLSVTNNEGTSNGKTFTVVSQWPADPCAVNSSPKSSYSSFTSTATPGGSGTITISFSGAAYSAVSQIVSYGPYSTPSSIAANVAALITANYTKYGLTARAFGHNVVYSGNKTLGTVTYATTGLSITNTTSSTAEAAAEAACGLAPPTPPAVCGIVNPKYVLAVLHDSVSWISQGMNNGRFVTYSLEYWPTKANTLGAPTTFQSTITEHLTAPMSFGLSTSSPTSGEFDDVLGNIGGINSGTYTADRCFTVTSNGQNLGQVLSYDAAGKHPADHIQIHLPTGPSILNNWTNPNGSPKDISIP